MDRPKIGDAVLYFDEYAKQHHALVTAVWGFETDQVPSLNLVHVVADASRVDNYGRQIERESSVVHKSSQPAHGRYWSESPPVE